MEINANVVVNSDIDWRMVNGLSIVLFAQLVLAKLLQSVGSGCQKD